MVGFVFTGIDSARISSVQCNKGNNNDNYYFSSYTHMAATDCRSPQTTNGTILCFNPSFGLYKSWRSTPCMVYCTCTVGCVRDRVGVKATRDEIIITRDHNAVRLVLGNFDVLVHLHVVANCQKPVPAVGGWRHFLIRFCPGSLYLSLTWLLKSSTCKCTGQVVVMLSICTAAKSLFRGVHDCTQLGWKVASF